MDTRGPSRARPGAIYTRGVVPRTALLGLVACAAACSFDQGFDGTRYRCGDGERCPDGQSCVGGVCAVVAATCSDGLKNGSESDVDCGGASCPKCAIGKACTAATDCVLVGGFAQCQNNTCVVPGASCNDGVKNGAESDVDCGGACAAKCGSGLGCGAVSLLTDECPVAVAASVLAYFDRENAGQCGSCFNGTAAMAAAAGALRDGTATAEDVERLDRWSVVLRGRGACATLDAATNIAASLLAKFPDDVARHLAGDCPDCGTTVFTAERPFEVVWVEAG